VAAVLGIRPVDATIPCDCPGTNCPSPQCCEALCDHKACASAGSFSGCDADVGCTYGSCGEFCVLADPMYPCYSAGGLTGTPRNCGATGPGGCDGAHCSTGCTDTYCPNGSEFPCSPNAAIDCACGYYRCLNPHTCSYGNGNYDNGCSKVCSKSSNSTACIGNQNYCGQMGYYYCACPVYGANCSNPGDSYNGYVYQNTKGCDMCITSGYGNCNHKACNSGSIPCTPPP